MRNFFKFFLASILALFVFSVICLFVGIGMINQLTAPETVSTGNKAILVIDLSNSYKEIPDINVLSKLKKRDQYDVPSLFDLIRMIRYAKGDSSIKGIYIKCDENNNGFASSEEIRDAIADFKTTNKFVIAFGDVIPQRAYYVANIADRIYCNPQGGVEWKGFAMQMAFVKGTLEKLEIKPQIFYAGKFKSATEPFREYKMTDANRIQSSELLHDLYARFLQSTADSRHVDTATLHRYANEGSIRFAADALRYKLVDGLKYDDEVKEEMKGLVRASGIDKLNFVTSGKYAQAVSFKENGKNKIALIYAMGEVIDGNGERQAIGSDSYRSMIRKVRMDASVKAIVVRINSGGGSALASENIWRELSIAKKDKPVVISFGDVAASGAYYLSCNADSIFADPNTITGSIGVFSLIPDMQEFFNNKLGITFDEVNTSPDANGFTITKPLSDMQKRYIQSSVDSIYLTFKERVAQGRNRDVNYIDSIAQGRVWTGTRALQLGLVDRLGGMKDAVTAASRMAGISDYRLKEYPESQSLMELLFSSNKKTIRESALKEELGNDGFRTYTTMAKIRKMLGITQARLPFEFTID